MDFDRRSRCPHCRALVHSNVCMICGKSAFEDVESPATRRRATWRSRIDRKALLRQASVLTGIAVFAAATIYVLTREDPLPEPNALPPPEETSLTTSTTSPGQAPSVDRGDDGSGRFTTAVDDGIGRDVGLGLSPWEEVPPLNFVTGEFLDADIDFSSDIARVAELLDAFPAVFTMEPLADNEILTFIGAVDLDVTEQTQPFAARTLSSRTGAIGELWLIASGGSAAGDEYLAAARSRWDIAFAVDQFAPTPGLRLWKLGEDSTNQMWVSELTTDSVTIVQVPVGLAPTALATVIEAWRANLRSG